MLRKTIVILNLLFVILSLKPNETEIDYKVKGGNSWEEYDPSLFTKLQSIEALIRNADSAVGIENRHSLPYCEYIANLLRKRFYHGYSSYSFHENPIAALLGRFVWDHLSAVVIPDDILKYPMAACSQQSIVLVACFKEIGIDYRKVGFPHHYATEAKINGQWYFFDTNMEPDFNHHRESIEAIIKHKRLHAIYTHFAPSYIDYALANYRYGKINAAPAPNATLLHRASLILFNLLVALNILLSFRWIYHKTFRKEKISFA